MISIEWILNTIGIHPHLRGFGYILDIVKLTYETNSVTLKPLYEKLSAKYNVSSHSIVNGIRKACDSSFLSGKHVNLNVILKTDAVEKNHPLTNSEVIFFISSFMKSSSYDKSAEYVYSLFDHANASE